MGFLFLFISLQNITLYICEDIVFSLVNVFSYINDVSSSHKAFCLSSSFSLLPYTNASQTSSTLYMTISLPLILVKFNCKCVM